MIRSLYTAATGMSAQQLNMDVIANNLANVNTTGFKRSRADFQDLLYQNSRAAGSSATQGAQVPTGIQVGLGTRTAAVERIHTPGDRRATSNPLDLSIEGDGFFQVQMTDGQVGYTRDGTFRVNGEGSLVNSDGLVVQTQITIASDIIEVSVGIDGTVQGKAQGESVTRELGKILSTMPLLLGYVAAGLTKQKQALHDVVARCIYGVDLNPMAADLAKVSLWLEALEPGKPLTFLDAHIKCGNSLLGTTPELIAQGIPDEAYFALDATDDRALVRELKRRNAQERAGQTAMLEFAGQASIEQLQALAQAVEAIEPDSISALRRKAARHKELLSSDNYLRTKLASDAWCAAFFVGAQVDGPITSAGLRAIESMTDAIPWHLSAPIAETAARLRFFHWQLEFSKVFGRGGFSAVIGNPPWEKTTVLEREYFADLPLIGSERRSNVRKRRIAELEAEQPDRYAAWRRAKRDEHALNRFLRTSGLYPGTGVGELNLYPLFVELGTRTTSKAGQIGLIIKTGMLLSSTWSDFCATLLESDQIRSAFDFRNWKGWFPDVGYHERFTLLTLGAHRGEPSKFGFYLDFPEQVADTTTTYTMSAAQAVRLNPVTKSVPSFASVRDKDQVVELYNRLPIVGDEHGAWAARYTRGFDMSVDSAKFHDLEALVAAGFVPHADGRLVRGRERFVPLYEGKYIHQYDHRFGSFEGIGRTDRFGIKAATHTPSTDQKGDPRYHITPRYWVAEQSAAENALQRRLPTAAVIAFRDTTNVISNMRTSMAALVPAFAFSNTAPNVVIDSKDPREARRRTLIFLGLMNSIPFDYLLRQKFYGIHFLRSIFIQLAAPTPSDLNGIAEDLVAISHELSHTSTALDAYFDDCAGAASHPKWDTNRRQELRCRVDALLFRAYGIDASVVERILDTFPILRRTEEETWGCFQTRELTLAALEEV